MSEGDYPKRKPHYCKEQTRCQPLGWGGGLGPSHHAPDHSWPREPFLGNQTLPNRTPIGYLFLGSSAKIMVAQFDLGKGNQIQDCLRAGGARDQVRLDFLARFLWCLPRAVCEQLLRLRMAASP